MGATIGGASPYDPPPIRRLRVYAFDPRASLDADTALINQAVLELPWDAGLAAGPVSDDLEVVDSAGGAPVDLDDPHLLAQDGLAPTEGDPRFRRQMAFAVATNTIRLFERALGRRVLWARRDERTSAPARLRIDVAAMEQRNAYYHPGETALKFGHFLSTAGVAAATPGGQRVFTALSHDVVAHETTHAIVDGLHPRLAEPTSHDSPAFHEAIADAVALFTRFTNPVLVRHALARQRGRLDVRGLLTGLARQYGEAGAEAAGGGALRDAVDPADAGRDEATLAGALGRAEDPARPHLRGQVLVQALFAAFAGILERRSADLRALAPRGQPMPAAILERLTLEAVATARQTLSMALRALDYLPPVDVRLGDYLRAIVTADADLVPHDPLFYRQTLIDAFRRRGIACDDCQSFAPEALRWPTPGSAAVNAADLIDASGDRLDLVPRFGREDAIAQADANRKRVYNWLMRSDGDAADRDWETALGLFFHQDRARKADGGALRTIEPLLADTPYLRVEVHSVRTTRRAGPDGLDLRQLVVQITQRRRGYLDPATQTAQDDGAAEIPPQFWFRGGATVIIDLREGRNGRITSIIRKSIADEHRLGRQRDYLLARFARPGVAVADAVRLAVDEPFRMAHGA